MKDQIIWICDSIKEFYQKKVSGPVREYIQTRVDETEFLIDDKENDADRFLREFNIELDGKGVPKTRNGLRCYERNIWDSREPSSIVDMDQPWEDDVKCHPSQYWNIELPDSEERLDDRIRELERTIENI